MANKDVDTRVTDSVSLKNTSATQEYMGSTVKNDTMGSSSSSETRGLTSTVGGNSNSNRSGEETGTGATASTSEYSSQGTNATNGTATTTGSSGKNSQENAEGTATTTTTANRANVVETRINTSTGGKVSTQNEDRGLKLRFRLVIQQRNPIVRQQN
jgi:hypothetical protein